MATRKATSRKKAATKKKAKPAGPAKPPTPGQKASRLTWRINGELKCAQMKYLLVGGMLVQMRDEKLYLALGHADMVEYAREDLRLGRATLFDYLRIYDWVSRNHKEWLEPHPKGFIPTLTDTSALIWIDTDLEKKNVDKDTRASLEKFQKQALDGKLRQADFARWRRSQRGPADTIKPILTSLRALRRRIAALAPEQPEALSQIDELIGILDNSRTLKVAGIDTILGFGVPELPGLRFA